MYDFSSDSSRCITVLCFGCNRFSVHFCDAGNHFGVSESLVIYDRRFARHAEIFDGERNKLSFAYFLITGVFGKNGYPDVFFDEISYRGDAVNLDYNVEVVHRFAD